EALDQQGHLQLAETLQSFLMKLGDSVCAAPLADRQRIVRLLVKEVVVGPDSILIRHSIPTPKREDDPEYRLRVGPGADPLPDGAPGEDRVDEIRCLLRHAPSAATGTDRAAFTRQRHALERTVVAPQAEKAMDEPPAPEEGAELALDEAGQS